MSHPQRDIRDQSGQALVEFALVLPVLALILFGLLHFGKALNYWNDATHLTAEGARFAAVNRTPDPSSGASLQAQILAQADSNELRNGSSSVPTPASVCIDFPSGTSRAGDPVRVKMSFAYSWIPLIRRGANVPLLNRGTNVATSTITSTTVMRLEATPTNYSAGCA